MTSEAMSGSRAFAVTTMRRLPSSRLIWLGPSVKLKVATCSSRMDCADCVRSPVNRHRQVLKTFNIVAYRFGQADDDQETSVTFEDDAGFAPTDRRANHLLNSREVSPSPASADLSMRDIEHG